MNLRVPRIQIAHLPTPIDPLPRLSAALGGPRLLIKRDDQTGLAFGGNKTRKLELLLAEAQANGARTLITAGATQSNHCRQTAAAAARFGFDCILVLTGQRPERVSGNLLLDHLLGAEIVWGHPAEREALLRRTFEQAWEQGRRPYLIPYGGSSPVGAAAYTLAMEELVDQIQSLPEASQPQWIVLASSSGGTQAGLTLGARVFDFRGKILGISVDQPAAALQSQVASLAEDTADFLGLHQTFAPEDILVNADYCKAGYGVMQDAEREAIHMFARLEGILLDPVYTGRAAAGLIDLVRKRFFAPTDTILFWHTGGTPALFAEQYQATLI